ncbi:MAG TPA: TIGR04211 family SH3 domain-containing protein [Deltaproteobacteria bacterium]|nr:TIGR04211 family SH3 domain-containing protein [Deltaproteobacteria bacterium]
MTKWTIVFFVSLGICLSSVPCRAEKAYVTNPTKITLRNGPGIKDKILAMLPEDELVEILNSEEGWTRVRLLAPKWKNKEGWVVSGFLVSHVPWEIQVGSLKKENAQLKEKLNKIEKEWSELSGEREALSGKLEKNGTALDTIRERYETLKREASGFLELKKKYQIEKTKMQDALATAEKLTKENSDLKASQRNTWFLTGAAVMLVGLIFGLVLGRREKKRRSSYY